MSGASICGADFYVPERVVTNDFFEQRNPFFKFDADGNEILENGKPKEVYTSDEDIQKLMGIRERRWAEDNQFVEDLGERASRRLLERTGVDPKDLEGIIVATVTPHYGFPNTAQLIQLRLGARNANYCADVADACAGFPHALHMAKQQMAEKPGFYLVVAAEILSRALDLRDANSPLFGDGAGAVLLEPSTKGLVGFYPKSDPFDGKWKYIIRDPKGYLRMPEGGRVLKLAVRGMVESVRQLKHDLGWADETVSLVVPHQANKRIIVEIQERLGFDRERVYMEGISKYGNVSSVTCAIGLAECMQQGRIKDGSRVIITAVGAGLTTSAYAIQF